VTLGVEAENHLAIEMQAASYQLRCGRG